MEFMESVANTSQNGHQKTDASLVKRPRRFARNKKPEIPLEEFHITALFWFTRFELLTSQMMFNLLTVDFPHKSEREVADMMKLLHDLEYLFLVPRDSQAPNVFQIDKKGAKVLVGLGIDKEQLSIHRNFIGYLDHNLMRDYFGTP